MNFEKLELQKSAKEFHDKELKFIISNETFKELAFDTAVKIGFNADKSKKFADDLLDECLLQNNAQKLEKLHTAVQKHKSSITKYELQDEFTSIYERKLRKIMDY